MLTSRLFEVPSPPDDAHLVNVLHSVCRALTAEINLKRIALLGDDGRPYRMIVAQGPLEFTSLMDALSTLRFGPSFGLIGVDAVLQRDPDRSR